MAPLNPPGRGDPAPGQVAEAVAALRTAVAGLAREVESVRRAQRQVASAGELSRLAATVADLSGTVSVIQSIGGGKPNRQTDADAIPSWLTLPRDQPSARAVLSDLTAWLRDVYLRYGDAGRDFPECWLWHPEIVEELVWLMYAWLAAYRDDDASVRAAGDWHDRLRPGVVRRIHGYATTCSLENHLPGRPRATGAPHVPLTDESTDGQRRAVEVIAAWWSEHRDQPAPSPTTDQMTAAAAAARQARTGTGGANGSHHPTGGTR